MNHADAYDRLVDLVGPRAAAAADAELRAHVAGCGICTTRLAALASVARGVASMGERPLELPAGLEDRVLAVPALDDRGPRRTLRRRLSLAVPTLLVTAAAAMIAVLVITAGPAQDQFRLDERVALRSMTTTGTEATVEIGMPRGEFRVLRLDVHHLPTASDQSFDLWMIDAKGAAMKAGTFGPDPDGSCKVELMVPASEEWTKMTITPSGAAPERSMIASS